MDRDTPRPRAGTSGTGTRTTTAAPREGGAAAQQQFEHPPRPQDQAPADAFKEAVRALGEVREYVAYYVAAKLDGIKLTFRRIGVLAVVGVIGLLAGGAVVATAAVLFCVGLAQAVATLLRGDYGPRMWLGNLIVGLVLLLGIGGGAWYLMQRLIGSSRKATVKKYELRRQRQRADYGHDVLQRAQEHGSSRDDQPR